MAAKQEIESMDDDSGFKYTRVQEIADDESDDDHFETLGEDKLFGENGCPAFVNNENACIDLFFNVVPSSTIAEVEKYLEASWKEQQEVTLRIIFNLGNVRKDGAGKQDRNNFYAGLLWLWKKEPQIVIKNSWLIPRHASLKCLLNVYMFIIHSDEEGSPYSLPAWTEGAEKSKKRERVSRTKMKENKAKKDDNRLKRWTEFAHSLGLSSYNDLRKKRDDAMIAHYTNKGLSSRHDSIPARIDTAWKTPEIAEQYAAFTKKKEEEAKKERKTSRKKERKQIFDRIRHSIENDKDKADLRSEVVRIFVKGLTKEFKQTNNGKQIGGLYSKWAPKQAGQHDKATGLSRDLMLKLLPALGKSVNENIGMDEYQRILSSLHEKSQVPEHYVGTGRWSEVNYNRMASRCRLLWGDKVFKKHDKERYNEFLNKAAVTSLTDTKAKEGVKTGVLLPHEVVTRSLKIDNQAEAMRAVEVNLQWWGLVKASRQALEAGQSAGYILPLCDVSGSMSGTPMEVAVALSLLLCEAIPKDSPLHGKMLTFESQPKLCTVNNIPDYDLNIDKSNLEDPKDTGKILKYLGDIRERATEVMGYSWGGSTNIEAAFDIVLLIATSNKLSQEFVSEMSLCIFSDMEFDEARAEYGSAEPWDTMHQTIEKKFRSAGYPEMPKLVYWNLRASRSQPVKEANKKNVVLLSGFSSGLLKSFLAGAWDQFTPLHQMLQALSGRDYQLLKI